ncbi:MAG TPA: hypothetical protein VGS06_05630 [Streptosporangiaceae bacterium]|nr:hypothetical protein [Streptosporangiaceae bacterium]
MSSRRKLDSRLPAYQDEDASGQHPCSRRPPELCDSARMVDQGDGTSRREPGLTPRAFCEPCRSRIITCLEELPSAYERLEEAIADPVRRTNPVRVMPGSRVLVPVEVDALMRPMSAVLGGWFARVRHVPGLELTDPGVLHDSPEGIKAACEAMARHVTPLLALQPGWTTRIYTWPPGDPMPPGVEDEIGDEEIVAIGDGWVKVTVQRSGADAGNEILDLHWRGRRLLGESKARPEPFDGVPCRACEAMTLERAEPPSDPSLSANHSRCPECRDEMDRETFTQWADTYVSWARGAGIQKCRRCSLAEPRHDECCWAACSCGEGEHPRRPAAA